MEINNRSGIIYSIRCFFRNLKKAFANSRINYRTNLYECDIVKVENAVSKSSFKIGIFKKSGWRGLDRLLKIIENLRKKRDREQVIILLEEIAYSMFEYIELSEKPSYRIVDNIVGYIEVCGVYSSYMKEAEIVEILKSIYIPKVKMEED
ncbi:hypothetical protein [uncultured Clostridium sp.]|uniref:hypothetical protein n=1 Tax=uncultured Clostridium sp. TaxID=59620 RepID=UPI00261B344D|nr:hypothetical protein [uncultured Clostridium sp.]